ncbi:flagellar hook protein FlgE [Naasia sp. SYSU D00057]|uniref:flagellar hook protein FlgE n=1 Tax=Naasia sp. SYSU D00057 TaxID=2817380 RepID=UPI001B300835|nr:flagellar hook protein FlgE [Naasia sp. SYSU D00057]
MLRSLYSGISGLRAHQTMLDVTGNNIANVNTTAFKGSSVLFQDTLSQLTAGAGLAGADIGGTNPSQVGLGVQVAGISTNLTQGSTQATGRNTDMMISGDGYFVTEQAGETLYTRAGSFNWDSLGRLTTADGSLLQGWSAANGSIAPGGVVGPILIPKGTVSQAKQSTLAAVSGNLPSDAANGTVIRSDVQVYDAVGNSRTLSVDFTFDKGAGTWGISASDGTGAPVTGTLSFTDGVATGGTSVVINGVTLDLTKVSGFAQLKTVGIVRQDGQPAGSLQSFNISADGTLVGSFSNGATEPLARLALATFVNPSGLEKAGSSSYRASVNSGDPALGTAGSDGFGTLSGGALEMSNVDLSAEFTNLIVAQRGFQANARIITTSDEVLQELTNLKR